VRVARLDAERMSSTSYRLLQVQAAEVAITRESNFSNLFLTFCSLFQPFERLQPTSQHFLEERTTVEPTVNISDGRFSDSLYAWKIAKFDYSATAPLRATPYNAAGAGLSQSQHWLNTRGGL